MAAHYKRKVGKIHPKKIHRKIKLRFKHIMLSFFLLVGLFFAVQQIYIFAITWDKLEVRDITVFCKNQEIRKSIQKDIEGKRFGNILLLDLKDLQEKLLSHPRVRNVHIRKIFPPALNITVEEREPFAVLKNKDLFLIDSEGVFVSKVEQESRILPLLIDEEYFQEHYRDKIRLAWECLESIYHEDRKKIEILDLSESMNIKVKTRGSRTWLFLGKDHYGERFRRFLTEKSNLERYGTLEYVDLRFRDRFFIKPLEEYPPKDTPTSEKEEN